MGDPTRAASLVPSDPDPQWGREWKNRKAPSSKSRNTLIDRLSARLS